MLTAKVQGTRSRPYDVWIMFNDVDEHMWIENECTCPVGFECKHVAALLIAGLAPTCPNKPSPACVPNWWAGSMLFERGIWLRPQAGKERSPGRPMRSPVGVRLRLRVEGFAHGRIRMLAG